MSKQMTPAECAEYNELVKYWNTKKSPWYERNKHLAELKNRKHRPSFWLQPKQLELFAL
jgi:hypothetical protein